MFGVDGLIFRGETQTTPEGIGCSAERTGKAEAGCTEWRRQGDKSTQVKRQLQESRSHAQRT